MIKKLKQNKMVFDSFVAMGGGLLVGFINYAFNIVAGRLLGPEKFAEFGSTMALFYVGSVAGSTISLYITRQYREREQYSLFAYFRKFFSVGLLAALLLALTSPLVGHVYNLAWGYVVLLAVYLVFSLSTSVFSGVLVARKQFVSSQSVSLIGTIAKFVIGIGLLLLASETYLLFVGVIVASALALALYSYVLRGEHIWSGEKTAAPISRAFPYIMAVLVLQNLVFGGDVLAAQKYLTGAEAGYVTALSTFTKIIFWISISFSTVLYAHVVNPLDGSSPSRTKLKKSMLLATAVCWAGALLIYVSKQWLVPALFGQDYSGSSYLVKYMIFPLALYSIYQLLVQYALTSPKFRHVLAVGIVFILQNLAFALFARSGQAIYLIQGSVYVLGILLFIPFKTSSQ